MRLTEDQLDALKRGSLEPRGDLGRVKRFPTFSSSENTIQNLNLKAKYQGNRGQNAIKKWHNWVSLARQHSQVDFNIFFYFDHHRFFYWPIGHHRI